MHDQAEKLRLRMMRHAQQKEAKTLAVISGKGGVGKSNFSLNFSIALAKQGMKVLLFDMDIGMGNIDVLIGKNSNKNVVQFFHEQVPLQNIIEQGPAGLSYIAGGSGLNDFFRLNEERIEDFIREIRLLIYDYDFFVFDFGAGMDEETVRFLRAIDHVFVIITPDPTSIMNAYSAMKFLLMDHPHSQLYLVGNRMKNDKENEKILSKMNRALDVFLNKQGTILGYIPEDKAVEKAVQTQSPFLIGSPHSKASRHMLLLVRDFLENEGMEVVPNQEPVRFVRQLKAFLTGKNVQI